VTAGEIIVSLVCLALGYWVVSKVLGTPSDETAPVKPSTDGDARSSSSQAEEAPAEDAPAKDAPAGEASAEEAVTLSNWFRILDVGEHASREQIRAAYKRKISQYHPDKVNQMGQEIRELAGRKSQQINAAYELGMRAAERDGRL